MFKASKASAIRALTTVRSMGQIVPRQAKRFYTQTAETAQTAQNSTKQNPRITIELKMPASLTSVALTYKECLALSLKGGMMPKHMIGRPYDAIQKTYYKIGHMFWAIAGACGFGFGSYMIYDDAKRFGHTKFNLGSAALCGTVGGVLAAVCSYPFVMYWPIFAPPVIVLGGLSMIDINVRRRR